MRGRCSGEEVKMVEDRNVEEGDGREWEEGMRESGVV